jgi:hypothetical protein
LAAQQTRYAHAAKERLEKLFNKSAKAISSRAT